LQGLKQFFTEHFPSLSKALKWLAILSWDFTHFPASSITRNSFAGSPKGAYEFTLLAGDPIKVECLLLA